MQGAKGSQNVVWGGGTGGNINFFNFGAITVSGTAPGDTYGVPWLPYLSGFTGVSGGGNGVGGKTNDTDFEGLGGNGGSIWANTEPGSTIVLQGAGSGAATINGITAYSEGGLGGCACRDGYGYGASGSGGTVAVDHAGSITSTATDSIGIVAASIGGAGGLYQSTGIDPQYGPSGPGGAVAVTVESGGSIDLSNGSGIGILATSAVGASIGPVYGSASGGPVTVTIEPGGSIASTGNGRFNIGVLAVSTGSAAVLEPFDTNAIAAGGSGYSGAVTVTNGGSITTLGQMAIGIAALSVGGAGIVTNEEASGVNILGSDSATGFNASGGTVSVANSGTIATNGASAFGIVALSAGAGGLANVVSNAVPGSSGLIVGGNATDNDPGGSVTVTNSGTVTTGDGKGDGKVAIGIIAQSIGGGGGSAGGTGTAALIGDEGGGGGNGGTVTVANTGGTVITYDDGAIGILAQSIGGGGGNGGNAAGIFVATGGNGGNGGNGGTVNVTLSGPGGIVTWGDFAAGVIEQSVGGGGGNGGFGTSAGLFVDVSEGGSGGNGGTGGAITFTNSQTVVTHGQDSLGLLAQSVGGGGGNGGAATADSLGAGLSITMAVGGTGGGGGNGGAVTLNNNFNLHTTGPDSIGIIAQSVGGGGGTGGASMAKSLSVGFAELPTISFSAALGASGGSGGSGNNVTINNAGQIITTGDGAHGLLAQSIGAGGGNGGDSTAGSYAVLSATAVINLSTALGASGGVGGNGGNVTVLDGSTADCPGCNSVTETGGQNAAGILAQSIGAGGGNSTAGQASTGAPTWAGDSADTSVNLSVGLGASGGAGGSGGTVSVTLGAGSLISTTGSTSPGILAQSIGGGGGTSSGDTFGAGVNTAYLNLGVGGSGAGGANGGTVCVVNGGTISTTSGDSVGVLAQSIGGGGGLAGSNDAGAAITAAGQVANVISTPDSYNTYTANVAVGGTGGGGGSGNTVTVTNSGTITTLGERAYGIEAQSIGGGGGDGGTATAVADKTSTGGSGSADVAVGGSGGTSGNGGDVAVTSSGAIVTAGYNADGILAQSIGGGGGVAGNGSVSTSTTIGIGGSGSKSSGAGGTGGTVNVTTGVGGTIVTLGDDAVGILAESIGGGGGTATGGCTNSISPGLLSEKATACFGNVGVSAATGGPAEFLPIFDVVPSADIILSVGGSAGASGNGNTVVVNINDAIVTTGARSMAIVAQSIGGGGGYATAAAPSISGNSIAPAAGANSAAGGGVLVGLASTGSITTYGAGAWGILAQSIGGGGGFSGDPSLTMVLPVSNSLPQTGSPGANGGGVAVTVNGNITTYGTNAHGIFAQSIGGGGGVAAGCCNSPTSYLIAGTAAPVSSTYWGSGGAINIIQGAGSAIEATGLSSVGIFAQSSGNATTQNPITINIAGLVMGGYGWYSTGIMVSGGISTGGSTAASVQNAITIQPTGVLGSVSGIYGTAIMANDSITNVTNNGGITGAVDLGTGSASGGAPGWFTNNGVFNTGWEVVTTLLTNSGTMNIGIPGVIESTSLAGNFTQTGSGRFGVTIDSLNNASSLLQVSGTASLAGSVVPSAISLLPGTTTVLTAGSLSSTATAQSSLLFNWNIATTSTSLSLSPTANFAPAGVALSSTQASEAGYLQSAWNKSDAALAKTFASLSSLQSASSYTASLNSVSPLAALVEAAAQAHTAGTVLGAAMSCPVFVDQGVLLGEDSCVWAKFTGQRAEQYATAAMPGSQVDSTTYRMGGQHEIAPNWYLGGSIAMGQSWSSETGGSSGTGQTFDGSAALKYVNGPWLFASSAAFATGSFHNERVVGVPGSSAVLTSDSNLFLAGGRLRGGYEFAFNGWYLRPYGDLDLTYTNIPGFRESGPSAYALNVHGSSQTCVAVSPMVEFGGRYSINPATTLRPYLAVGVSFLPNSTRVVDANFVAASAGEGSFQTSIESPNTLGDLELGVQLYRAGGFEVKAEYGLKAGESYLSQSGSARVAYHF